MSRIDFGARLRAARAAKGLSQRELADLVGVTPPQICLIESGANNPSDRVAARIVRVIPEVESYMRPSREQIGQWVRDARVERGWSQRYLEHRIGLSSGCVSHIETGLRRPSRKTWTLLRRALRGLPTATRIHLA